MKPATKPILFIVSRHDRSCFALSPSVPLYDSISGIRFLNSSSPFSQSSFDAKRLSRFHWSSRATSLLVGMAGAAVLMNAPCRIR